MGSHGEVLGAVLGLPLFPAAISKTRAGSGLRVFLWEFLENNYQASQGFSQFVIDF